MAACRSHGGHGGGDQQEGGPRQGTRGYRAYDMSAVYRVQQIRGLLDSGLTTEIIRDILPYLSKPDEIHLHPDA